MKNSEIYELRNKLVEKAKLELINNPDSIQVVLFETISGEVLPFYVHNLQDSEDEEAFFNELKNSNRRRINHILAMWKENVIDLPKRSILQKVHALDEQNADTCVLLLSDTGLAGFKLSSLLQ